MGSRSVEMEKITGLAIFVDGESEIRNLVLNLLLTWRYLLTSLSARIQVEEAETIFTHSNLLNASLH